MPDRKPNNQPSELPTPRSNPHGDTGDGDTEIPQSEQGISNRAGDKDKDEDAEQDDERRFNK